MNIICLGDFKMRVVSLQDEFLKSALKENIPVTTYLTNGFQFRGTVTGFDNYVVLLDVEGRQNLVYKHAISTVIPSKNIVLADAGDLTEIDSSDD